ncbi:diacylglycerol kinase epsilon isoform X2 [Battus philenor]|uniref:diacylglycerol kinase epsilon isoform X2 n=1 Tax=Battus philenor TaxID=42288 RepID=UPI0035CEEB8C
MESYLSFFDFTTNYYFVIGGFFLSYLIYRILQSILSDNNFMQTIYRPRGHTWRSIECNKSLPYNIYCTVCSKLMLPLVGLFCECCAVSACKKCNRVLDKKIRCKQITWPSNKPFFHHWVNIGTASGKSGDSNEHLKKLFCSWCQRTKIVEENSNIDNEQCDFNKYKKIIIPPTCVQVDKGSICNIKSLPDDDWEPLIILANRKSGSSRSDEVLSIFRGLLNPIQVVDISSISPESVIKWLPERCRLLVAGGDGTVAWVLNALQAASHVRASVGILPMGTGNDLSRVLGWGPGCSSLLDAHSIIKSIHIAEEQPLDRWKITITPKRGRLRRGRGERVLHAYNYASVGVDAQVALDFHRARAQFLYCFANRTLNYIAYLFLGMGRAIDDGGCQGLERRLRLFLDDQREPLPLPPLQALVALNIPSWGAGVHLWSSRYFVVIPYCKTSSRARRAVSLRPSESS